MTLKRILPVVIILLWNSFSMSQVTSKIGTTAAPFLQIGVGSRASAMGEAYSAVAEDATAMCWNPSGIDFYKNNDVSMNYSQWIASMKFLNFGGVLHLEGAGSFGLSITSLTVPEQVVTTVEEPEGLGTRWDAEDLAIGVSYAKKLTDRFAFGASVKYINRRIWNENANAIAADFGVSYVLPWQGLRMGMSIMNFGSKLKMEGTDLAVLYDSDPTSAGNNDGIIAMQNARAWALPLSFRFGLAFDVFRNNFHSLLLTGDYIHPNDNFSSVNVGAEYGFMDYFFARAGYKNIGLDESQTGLTLGFGVKYSLFGADYSYVKLKDLGFVQQFSLKLLF